MSITDDNIGNNPNTTYGTQWKYINNGVLTPQSFGAVADGSNDDTSAIQSAIDFAATNKYTILYPPGEYLVTDTISNQTLTDLTMLGLGDVTITAGGNVSGADGELFLLGNTSVSDKIVIRNISFNAEHSTYSSNDRCLYLRAYSVSVENCSFTDYGVYGVQCNQDGQEYETYRFYAKNVVGDGGSSAIYCKGGGVKFASDCFVKDTTGGPIYFQGDADDSGGTDNGIGYGQASITNCEFVDCSSGGQMRHCANGVFSNNIIRNPTTRGITLGNSQGATTVLGNTIVLDKEGLSISGAIEVDIVENNPADSSIYGNIVVSGNSIENLTSTSTMSYAVRFTGVKNCIVSGNVLGGSNNGVIVTADSYCVNHTYTNNLIANYTGDGVRINGDQTTLIGNTFRPATSGQDYYRGTFEAVVGNVFYDTGNCANAINFSGNVFPDLPAAGYSVFTSGSTETTKPKLFNTITSTSTIVNCGYDHVIADTTSGNITLTLPLISNVGYGQTITILKPIFSNKILLDTQGSDTIRFGNTASAPFNNVIINGETGTVSLMSIDDQGTDTWLAINEVTKDGIKCHGGSPNGTGVSGTIDTTASQTITVTNGIITSIV